MPAGVLISVVRWFASHLIVLTLLGFAVVGLFVFDAKAPTGAVQSRAESASDATIRNGVAVESSPPAEVPSAPDTIAKAPVPPAKPTAQGPKLIGGSIPVYDLRNRSAPDAEGFRPGALTPETQPQVTSNRETRLQSARRAFWNGQFEVAEGIYMDLIAQYPDDADVFGELGNLYEGMGQADLASDAFFEAGVRLRAMGDREKLSQVIEILKKAGDERYQSLSDP